MWRFIGLYTLTPGIHSKKTRSGVCCRICLCSDMLLPVNACVGDLAACAYSCGVLKEQGGFRYCLHFCSSGGRGVAVVVYDPTGAALVTLPTCLVVDTVHVVQGWPTLAFLGGSIRFQRANAWLAKMAEPWKHTAMRVQLNGKVVNYGRIISI